MPKNPEREGSPRLITPQQIEQEYGIKRSTLYTYRHRPTFPQPVKVEGSIKTFYRADEVAAWLAANPKQQGKRTDLATKTQPQGEPVTTETDPRTVILSDLSHPEWNSVSESHGMPYDDAVKLVDAYRAKVLREAADFFRGLSVTGTTITTQEAEAELRRMADEAEAQDG